MRLSNLRPGPLSIATVLLAGLCFANTANSDELTVNGYTQIAKDRVSRTEFTYTYSAAITNNGPAVEDVSASLSSSSPRTQVVDGDLEFGAVAAGTSVQSQDTFTIRQDRRYPIDWTLLTWTVDSTPVGAGHVIDSYGGTFEYPGGLTLVVPPSAVISPVEVEITLMDCGPLEAILNDRALSTKPVKNCLAAFAGAPSGFEFESPVLVRLPLESLASGTFPFLADIDENAGTYQILPTVIDYDGVAGIIQAQLTGFSGKVVGSTELSPGSEFGPEWAAEGEEIKARCANCGQIGPNLDFCTSLDAYQPPCCLIPPAARVGCYANCDCCKEKRVQVVVSGVDFASGDCQLLGSDIEVTYPDCPGSPTYTDSVGEASEDCGDDTIWTITVEPDSAEIQACTDVTFTATIQGASPDGSVQYKTVDLPAFWTSRDESVGGFSGADGRLEGKSAGSTTIEARISAASPIDAVGEATVKVNSNIESYTVDPASESIKIDDEVLLTAEAIAASATVGPPPEANDTEWSSNKPGVASVTPAGSLATVLGVDKGSATITAKLEYLCETVTATSGITVECHEVTFTPSSDSLDLVVGESHLLFVEATDSEGTMLDTSGVTWRSAAGTVVGLQLLQGQETVVEALQPTVLGPVPVTATYDDGCQTKDAVTVVTVTCMHLELSVTEGLVEVDAFLPIAVSALDKDGNPVSVDESSIQWSSSDSNVAAVIPSVGGVVSVIGISPGNATITAEYDAGPCGVITESASIQVGMGIAGVWNISPYAQFEQCRDTDFPGWFEEEGWKDFTINIEQPVGEDETIITATYVPDVGAVLEGNWDRTTGEFTLATDTSNPSECGYLFYWDDGADLCAGALDCQFEACQNTTDISGTTAPTLDSLDAAASWYYAVTFSYKTLADGPRLYKTWECEGDALATGSR